MYTQCPECQIAFRVTVQVLQKAGGRVRCGGCGNAFSAVEHLSDGVPESAANASSSDNGEKESSVEDFEEKSKALLETLDELAGPQDIRIEDTGVEWRVLDDSEAESETADDDSGTQSSLDLSSESDDNPSEPTFERRYDDNTQLPDDFADEEDVPFTPDTADSPKRRSTDVDEQQTDFDTHQVDIALQDDDTWADLLDDEDEPVEIDAAEEPADEKDNLARQLEAAEAQQIADDSALLPQLAASLAETLQQQEGNGGENIPFEIEEELAAIHSELSAVGESTTDSATKDESDDDNQDDNDQEDEDELTAEEEADIVQKLRDSTGSFQKQIAAAQQSLDRGEKDDVKSAEEDHEADDEELHLEADDSEDETAADEAKAEVQTEAAVDENDIRAQLSATYSDLDTSELAGAGDSETDPDEISAEERFSQTMIRAGIDPAALDDENVETIIMEGDFVRGTPDDDGATGENKSIAALDEQKSLVDTYMLNKGKVRGGRRRTDPASYGMLAGIAFLLVLLAAQYLHASRETFATYGAFNQTIGPVYRVLGNPVTPHWNIKGWQFESTSGSTDENDQLLTVFSRVRNNSEDPLPYPLVHVSLTDRWEDIIGSKILEPSEYLAGDMDPRIPIAPGDSFTAVIAIERPSREATGFQLYVCYRVSPGRVRCATEDFKD